MSRVTKKKSEIKRKNRITFIIVSIIIVSIIMNLIDFIVKPNYWVKSIIKMIVFMSAPVIYFSRNRSEIPKIRGYLTYSNKYLGLVMGLGTLCCGIIILGYMLLKDFVDFSGIVGTLVTDIGVDNDNFIYVSFYIMFINSLLEEILFRGFGFLYLIDRCNLRKDIAYTFSSVVFAFYHIGMTIGWVEPLAYIVGFIGLIIAGLIFCKLDEKSKNLGNSWFVHMCANFGINTVGMMLFGII